MGEYGAQDKMLVLITGRFRAEIVAERELEGVGRVAQRLCRGGGRCGGGGTIETQQQDESGNKMLGHDGYGIEFDVVLTNSLRAPEFVYNGSSKTILITEICPNYSFR